MKKVIWFLDNRLEEFLISVFLAYFCLACVLQVLFRFVFQMPVAWTDETAKYSFIWLLFIGAAEAAKRGGHIRIDILENLIKNAKARSVLKNVAMAIFLIFSIAATIVGAMVCLRTLERPQMTPVLRISYAWVSLSLPVGMGLTSFRLIQNFIRGGAKKPAQGDSEEEAYV